MRIREILAALTITVVLFAASTASAQTGAPLLVDVDWLSQHLPDRDLVVLQVGGDDHYAAGHIPGARLISEDDVSRPHNHSNMKDMMLELPDADTLRAKVAGFGISNTSRIVVMPAGRARCSRRRGSSSRSTTWAWARAPRCSTEASPRGSAQGSR